MKKNHEIARKVYYIVAILSVVILIVGLMLTGIEGFSFFTQVPKLDYMIIGVPFGLWAWLLIVGLLFIRKNRVVVTILIALMIPNIFAIVLLYEYSYTLLEILKWYVMILSFGLVII